MLRSAANGHTVEANDWQRGWGLYMIEGVSFLKIMILVVLGAMFSIIAAVVIGITTEKPELAVGVFAAIVAVVPIVLGVPGFIGRL